MRLPLLVVGLLLGSLVLAATPVASAEPLGDGDPLFSCIPESPCCEAAGVKAIVECLKEGPEPCRIGAYYYC